jgi:predicted phage tail component-like protein
LPGFTFNNIHSSSIVGLIFRSKNRQILPSTQDVYLEIPQRDGSYLFAGAENDRIIEVEITITANTIQERQQRARQLAAWLRTKERKKLIFDDEPDKYYLAKVSSQVDFETVVKLGKALILFRCLPYAYSEVNTLETTVTNSNPIFVFNNGNTETPQEITVTNLGANTLNGFKIKIIKNQ